MQKKNPSRLMCPKVVKSGTVGVRDRRDGRVPPPRRSNHTPNLKTCKNVSTHLNSDKNTPTHRRREWVSLLSRARTSWTQKTAITSSLDSPPSSETTRGRHRISSRSTTMMRSRTVLGMRGPPRPRPPRLKHHQYAVHPVGRRPVASPTLVLCRPPGAIARRVRWAKWKSPTFIPQ